MKSSRVTCFLGRVDFRDLIYCFRDHLNHLPSDQMAAYTTVLRPLRFPGFGGLPLSKVIWDAWNSIEGHPLVNCMVRDFQSHDEFPRQNSLLH